MPATIEDPVLIAEAEAADAASLVKQLEESVINGDTDVEPEHIAAQESLARFAELRAEATRRKAQTVRQEERTAALRTLHDDIAGSLNADGKDLVKLLRAVEKSFEDFISGVEARDARFQGWKTALVALGVPDLPILTTPSAEDGNLGQHAGMIVVDNSYTAIVSPYNFLRRALGRVALRHETARIEEGIGTYTVGTDEVYDDFATALAPVVGWDQ